MNIHLFGASSLVGINLQELLNDSGDYQKIISYSSSKRDENYFDLKDLSTYNLIDKDSESLIISFAPIWLFEEFLQKSLKFNPDLFLNVKGFIICSSSSSETKRFSANKFDKNLSKKLIISEELILKIAKFLNKKCVIIQPSLIYGSIGKIKDKNINKIIKILKLVPFILLPKESGLRQPIHISQLAKVFLKFTEDISKNKESFERFNFSKILIGGDEEISYEVMIKKILSTLKSKNKAIRCICITIPNRFFLFLFFPLIIISPKKFAAIERMTCNLSGFKKVNELIEKKFEYFPIEPFY